MYTEEYYRVENDPELMAVIDHYVKLSNNENSKYEFIKIMQRIADCNFVFKPDIIKLEKEFKCPIRHKLLEAPEFYCKIYAINFNDLDKCFGRGRGESKKHKLTFERIRTAITNLI